MKVDIIICHRIITTCCNNNIKHHTQKVDPVLCLYVATYLMCVLENEYLQDKVLRGNGILCRLVSMKLKEDTTSHKCKNYCSKKLWTVCVSDVEWVKVEHVVKTEPVANVIKK